METHLMPTAFLLLQICLLTAYALQGGFTLCYGLMLFWGHRPQESSIRRCFSWLHRLLLLLVVVALFAGLHIARSPEPFPVKIFLVGNWIILPDFTLSFSLRVDELAYMYTLMALIISSIIVHFSFQFLHRDQRFERFFFLVEVLCFAVCTIALAGNYNLIFVGWELAGMASVLLISFFQQNVRSAQNSLRAITYYRLCDVAFLLALVGIHHQPEEHRTLIGALLILASLAKAGQFPFINFLPRTMEGPTASSAIFYGALSIHLGPYLLLRCQEFWQHSPPLHLLIGTIGLLSAISSALIGRTRHDAKTLLAYASTGQVGIIYIELSLGYTDFAQIHIIAHAGMRIWQFLRTSSLIEDLMENSEFSQEYRLKKKISVEYFLPKKLNKTLYVHAMQGLYMDLWQAHFFLRPIRFLGKGMQNLWQSTPQRWKLISTYILLLALMGPFPSLLLGENPLNPQGLKFAICLLLFHAMVRTILALTQSSWMKAQWSLYCSQLSLILIGIFCFDLGRMGAFFLSINTFLCFFVLFTMQKDLIQRYQRDDLHSYWGLGQREKLHEKIFLIAGLLSMGLPGGLAFFGEDLLFHSLLDISALLTVFHVILMGLNGIAFYRMYHFVFMGQLHSPAPLSSPSLLESGKKFSWALIPLAGIFIMGLIPQGLLDLRQRMLPQSLRDLQEQKSREQKQALHQLEKRHSRRPLSPSQRSVVSSD